MEPNHYLAVVIDYLFRHRPQWSAQRGGRQDRRQHRDDRSRGARGSVAGSTKFRSASNGFRRVSFDGSLGFGGEESAGASLAAPRRLGVDDGQGRPRSGAAVGGDHRAAAARIRPSCTRELTARTRRRRCPIASRRRRRRRRKRSSRSSRRSKSAVTMLAGEKIEQVLDRAPGNDAPIGGIKVIAAQRLVRRAAVRHRGDLQDLRGEFQRRRPSAEHSPGSPEHRRRGACRQRRTPPT